MISTMTPIIIIILMFFHQYFLATRVDVLWNESAWKKRNNRSPIKNQRWKKYSDPLLKGGIHRFYPSKCGLVNFGLKTEINAGVELKRSEIIADLCSCSSSQFKTSSYQYSGCQILTRKRNVWNKKRWYLIYQVWSKMQYNVHHDLDNVIYSSKKKYQYNSVKRFYF